MSAITPAAVPGNILGVIIRNASARFWVYAVFFLLALVVRELVIGAVATGVASAASLDLFLTSLAVATAVIADLAPFVGVLAAANTNNSAREAVAAVVSAV